ncbi:MAG TPA: S-methyl-5'-thioadenosine phosphorylase [Thermodesulfobacteriota bacterium]|nr:S-methyl-5'-thioadenosine phosphorylase [Thermodesulfobacteriota bacterium]
MSAPVVAVIGGSGLYDLEGLEARREERVETPFGEPSDALITGLYRGRRVVFLPRHGRGHRLLPSELPSRANIWALKRVGVTHVLSVSAVGSMREELAPGDLVVVDQFVDRTRGRPQTFFGRGLVAHVAFADPVCPVLSRIVAEAAEAAAGARVHRGGTYLCIEGPQFSTRAESRIYRQWGVDVIGMTNLPEAKLAREAELCYATLALVTDYDCWHAAEAPVSVDRVVETLMRNVAAAKRVVAEAVVRVPAERTCPCPTALRDAILTERTRIPPEVRRELAPLLEPYLGTA